MKHTLFIILASLIFGQDLYGQELYGQQMWELVGDLNENGWADPGDTVLITLKSTVNTKTPINLVVSNLLEDPNLILVPESVISHVGKIVKGNTIGDETVLIDEITINPPWGTDHASFKAILREPITMNAASITNYADISIDGGAKISSNYIEIPLKTAAVSAQAPFFFQTPIGITSLILLFLIVVFGIARIRFPKLTT